MLGIGGPLGRTAAEPGAMSGTFVLPAGDLEKRAASVVVPVAIPVESILLTWPGGSAAPARVKSDVITLQQFAVPEEALQHIVDSGRACQVIVRGSAELPAASTASIVLRRKS